MQGRAAEVEAERLAAAELRDFSVGVIHGQMRSAEKAEAMEAFAAGATDVLVATTVIEVGIDVANATVMVIEGAERYGVSQLHQLRGRVGRGEHESICLLFPEDAGRAGAPAAEGGRARERRLQAGRGRPQPARRGRGAGHPPARPAALRRRRAARGHADAGGRPRRGAGSAARARLASTPPSSARCSRPPAAASAPAPPTRYPDSDMRPHRRHCGGACGDRGRARRAAAGRAARLEGAADLRPRPRGDLLGARRPRRRRQRARPLLRHRRPRDRGALARRRPARPWSIATPAPRSATSSTSASASGSSWSAPTSRAGSPTAAESADGPALRPRLRRCPL